MRYKSYLEVDFNIFADNVTRLRQQVPNKEVLFMVKANAYGHGLIPMVKFATQDLNLREFGCASLSEAIELREHIVDAAFEIYVFSDLELELDEYRALYSQKRILPVLSSLEQLDFFLQHSDFKHVPICLKFNTGMNRLGMAVEDVEQVVEKLKRAGRSEIYHLMSHFATTSLAVDKHKFAKSQQSQFEQLKSDLAAAGIKVERSSMANSGAIEQNFAYQSESHIRPGLMLYGPSSLIKKHRQASNWQGQSISSFKTNILQGFRVKKGDPVGYGATPCPRDGYILLLACGYGDGVSTHYQSVELEFQGHQGIVFGRVNMDMTALLFAPETEGHFDLKQEFIFWNHDTSRILNLADQMQTIVYELLCQISIRIPRKYTYA